MAEFKVYKNPEAVAQAAASYLFQQIQKCVDKKSKCHVVLPGGSTPARCLELLAEKPLPWQSVHWYPGDERCYPIGHAERNDTMIMEKLFSKDMSLAANLHAIPAELGAELGAENYAALLDTIGIIDIVVLGMGEDGHTASLFPGNSALKNQHSAVPVYDAPKPPAKRISIGLTTIRNASECIVIATGENKREALTKLKAGVTLPVGMVEPDVWFVDVAAVTDVEKPL